MSKAIAQNATNLAASGIGENNWDWQASVQRAANRKLGSGMTTERLAISRDALAAAAMSEFRAFFSAIYAKTDRIPANSANKAYEEADKFIKAKLALVNCHNVISVQRKYHYKRNGLMFTERVIATGENLLRLEEQHLACGILLRESKNRLGKLMASPGTNADREQILRDRITELEATLLFIESQQAKTKALLKPAKQEPAKQEPAKEEEPKQESPKEEPAKQESPKEEEPKEESPKEEEPDKEEPAEQEPAQE